MRRGFLGALVWAGFALLCWGSWLAFPRVPGVEPGPGLWAVIVDASASAVRRRPGWGARVREVVRAQERGAREAGSELRVLLVGRDVLRLEEEDFGVGVGWLDAAFESADFGAGTELDAALRAVEVDLLDARRRAGRVVIVGDGEWTGRDPAARLARLDRAGVACSRVGLGAARWPDLGIMGVRLPERLVAGEPLAAVCELAYWSGEVAVEGELVVERRDAAGMVRVVRALALPAGGGVWSVAVDLGPCADGAVEVEAAVRLVGSGALAGGDPVVENDVARGRTRSGGVILGLAAAEAERRGELEAWLSVAGGEGVEWRIVEVEDVGEWLAGSDVFVSYEVSTARLPAEWIGPFLEGGGGWLAVGGWGLLAEYWPVGTDGSAEASGWLPLVPVAGDAPEREVVFCVDGSGSMAGAPFESVRGALVELVRAALPSDRLALRFFTRGLGREIEIGGAGGAGRLAGLRELLDARVPGGSTDILSSVEALAAARKGSDVPGLVLLLSDGRDDGAFDVAGRAEALARSFEASETRLSVIGIGVEVDLKLLGELAGGEERVVVVDELAELAELFRREVARDRVRDGDAVEVEALSGAEFEDVAGLVRAWGGREAWPQVGKLGRMEARSGAVVVLQTAEGLPVLGLGRVGLGWAGVFPSRVAEGWARELGLAGDVWGPLWRMLGRGGEVGEGVRLVVRGEELVLELGDAGAAWPAVVRVEFRGSGVDGVERELGAVVLELGQGGVPGVVARRVGSLGGASGMGDRGGGLRGPWRAHLLAAGNGEELGVVRFEPPLGVEFRRFGGRELGLGVLGEGEVVVPAGGVAVPDERAPWAIGVGLALLGVGALLGYWSARRVLA